MRYVTENAQEMSWHKKNEYSKRFFKKIMEWPIKLYKDIVNSTDVVQIGYLTNSGK